MSTPVLIRLVSNAVAVANHAGIVFIKFFPISNMLNFVIVLCLKGTSFEILCKKES